MEYKNFNAIGEEKNQSLIDMVFDHLALPDSTFLGTRITKKMLIDNNELSSADKKLVTDVIQSVEWQNTLKPETLNIPVYVTETVEYIEVAVIRVVLKTDGKQKGKLNKINKLLHSLIPYPVILLVKQEDELAISLADKRINQADKSKLVIEHIYSSDWLFTKNLTENENYFLNDFSLKNTSSINYFELYHDFISMMLSLETSKIFGRYISKNQNNSKSISGASDGQSDNLDCSVFIEKTNEDKTYLLRELGALETELASIRNKIKKETQMNIKMQLNVEAKIIKDSIGQLKRSLQGQG
ncbi:MULTISPECIES: DUF4391 domain-containing protein [unclassified Colwellia]|uniref:DUF4391 domain-containing protein n=1 Tax=unclassified Colwellia TaxID=196834 RepID=UPI0015F5E594|nr:MULTISPECIES: DUF4391 domain-containing protein [unclassified Colwellia]MBA6233969.1 DUF4391 domain-containing protein [Colwellia sp. MB02u-7]MBA6236967.1 DUF4391 domain-containing protein [Colwellia sp. MB02u-11]MBA6300643.1 DUF4391 domain-containing protein [Colwellia sp. MB3u-22]MBA6310598.1 DUF4391 domain-containing protein [Colwellia sp. MB3u-64]